MYFDLTQQNKHNTQPLMEPPLYLMLFYGNSKCLQIRLIFHKSEKPPFWPILPRISTFGNSPHFPTLFRNHLFHPVLQTFEIMMWNLRHTTLQQNSQSQKQHSQLKFIHIVNFTNTTNYLEFDLTSNSHFGIADLSSFTLWTAFLTHSAEILKTCLFAPNLQDSENRPIYTKFQRFCEFHKHQPKICYTHTIPRSVSE